MCKDLTIKIAANSPSSLMKELLIFIFIMSKQIKSKERILKHGEVFTNRSEVKAMCDLVADKINDIHTTFLEPACGDGNFIEEVLTRKLLVVARNHNSTQNELNKHILLAASSIYGIEIQYDNVLSCRERMFNLVLSKYKKISKNEMSSDIKSSLKFILTKNIVHGNALTMKYEGKEEPLHFVNWSLFKNDFIMEEFMFEDLMRQEQVKGYFPKAVSNEQKDYRKLGEENV